MGANDGAVDHQILVVAIRGGRIEYLLPDAGMVADKADAPIVPVRIDGAQYSSLSRLKGKVRTRMFPKITLTVLPPRSVRIEGEMTARQRRAIAGRKLYDEMSGMIFATSETDGTLFQALLDAKDVNGGHAMVVEDVKREPMSYKKLIVGSMVLGRAFDPITRQGEAVEGIWEGGKLSIREANGIAELAIPRDIRQLDTIPVLGTGKVDHVAVNALVGQG